MWAANSVKRRCGVHFCKTDRKRGETNWTRSGSVDKPERLFSFITLIEFWDIHVYENWKGDAEAAPQISFDEGKCWWVP